MYTYQTKDCTTCRSGRMENGLKRKKEEQRAREGEGGNRRSKAFKSLYRGHAFGVSAARDLIIQTRYRDSFMIMVPKQSSVINRASKEA